MTGVTVVIPVGPEKHHADYLGEALLSVRQQTRQPDEVLLVDDMHGLTVEQAEGCRVYRTPWRLGVAGAFNAGVAMAVNERVVMLGADDALYPHAIERCIEAYGRWHWNDRAYFYMGVRYSDGREQNLPCGAAMVTKTLWRATGGFPPETGSGASDAAFISILLGNPGVAELVPVDSDKPSYWHRIHPNQDTASKGPWQEVIISSRNLLTREWKAPQWGRYA